MQTVTLGMHQRWTSAAATQIGTDVWEFRSRPETNISLGLTAARRQEPRPNIPRATLELRYQSAGSSFSTPPLPLISQPIQPNHMAKSQRLIRSRRKPPRLMALPRGLSCGFIAFRDQMAVFAPMWAYRSSAYRKRNLYHPIADLGYGALLLPKTAGTEKRGVLLSPRWPGGTRARLGRSYPFFRSESGAQPGKTQPENESISPSAVKWSALRHVTPQD
jgi:hypothetical protein